MVEITTTKRTAPSRLSIPAVAREIGSLDLLRPEVPYANAPGDHRDVFFLLCNVPKACAMTVHNQVELPFPRPPLSLVGFELPIAQVCQVGRIVDNWRARLTTSP